MNTKLSFGKILMTFGFITSLVGLVIGVTGLLFLNDPDFYLKRGDIITGSILFFTGIFTIMLGVLETK